MSSCTPAPAPLEEVRFGFIAPLSGPLSEKVGRPALEAVRLAVQEVNGRGGLEVGGRRYRWIVEVEDDADRPETAVHAARKLINRDGVVALIGPLLSRNALAVAAVAEAHQVPMVNPTATHTRLTHGRRYVFRVTLGDQHQGRALARFAFDELGCRRAAVLFDVASAYNRGFAEIFRQVFEHAGGRMVAFESYTTGENDFRRPLARIRDAAPEILVLPNYVDEVPVQARQARELGIEATFLGGNTWSDDTHAFDPIFEGSFFVNEWYAGAVSPQVRAFVTAYENLYGRRPGSVAALTYDGAGLLVEAIRGQQSYEGPAIRRGLADLRAHPGVTGTISFPGHGEPVRDVLILRIHAGRAEMYRRLEPGNGDVTPAP